MHALNLNCLNFLTELNSAATTTTRTCLSYNNSVDLQYCRRRRRVYWRCKGLRRARGVVACVGGGGGGESLSSFLSRSQTYALLRQQMEVAVKSEDYKEAARIRDSLRAFEEEEPILRLRRLIKEAVAEESFEDAARFRDELKEIAPNSFLKCLSDATTLEGDFEMKHVDIVGAQIFNVVIAPFSLSTVGDDSYSF